MADFDVSAAATLFTAASDAVRDLWNFYMVASFAAAGFAATAVGLSKRIALAITLAYCLFLGGHLSLLRHSILIEWAVAKDLRAWVPSQAGSFSQSITTLATTTDSWWISLALHLSIDACIVAVIWHKALQPQPKP